MLKNTSLQILHTDMTCIGQYDTAEVSFWCQQTLHTSLFIRMQTLEIPLQHTLHYSPSLHNGGGNPLSSLSLLSREIG